MSSRLEQVRAQLEKPILKRSIVFVLLTPVLFTLAFVYFLVSALRVYLRRSKSLPSGSYIVSVGNVSAGGTGKSPLVRRLAVDFLQRGFNVCVLSRGYGTGPNSQGFYFETALLEAEYHASGGRDLQNKRSRIRRLAKNDLSDESLELLYFLNHTNATCSLLEPKFVIAQYSRRSEFVKELAKIFPDSFGTTAKVGDSSNTEKRSVVFLDDGMQHVQCARDLDVCVWSLESFQSAPRYCFPFGIYREGFGAFFGRVTGRAQVHVWNAAQQPSTADLELEFSRTIQNADLFPNASHWLMQYRSMWAKQVQGLEAGGCQLVNLGDLQRPQLSGHAQCVVVTGIGAPQRFVKYLMQNFNLGSENFRTYFFRDHEAYGHGMREVFARSKDQIFLLTLKDWLRWSQDPRYQADTATQEVYICLVEALPLHVKDATKLSDSLISMLGCKEP